MNSSNSVSSERPAAVANGWFMLLVNVGVLIGSSAWLISMLVNQGHGGAAPGLYRILGSIFLSVLALISLGGHFTLQPNEARVLILFGAYRGTVRYSGFWWANPFYSRCRGSADGGTVEAVKSVAGKSTSSGSPATRLLSTKISLRVRNFNSDRLKVNDKRGNPVEIAAVVVWRVDDTAKAAFDVDDFESYVHIQSESAIRHIASLYAYDRVEESEPTLRESADEVAAALKKELQERLAKAGVVVEEARLTHLAYAPEIAQAMLRRQQAEAVIAARQKIVQGAVSMVGMALRELSEKEVIHLDEERKASMVSNLLVVLCGETEVTPVVNTGTLYQ